MLHEDFLIHGQRDSLPGHVKAAGAASSMPSMSPGAVEWWLIMAMLEACNGCSGAQERINPVSEASR